jgi:hypothetical protein
MDAEELAVRVDELADGGHELDHGARAARGGDKRGSVERADDPGASLELHTLRILAGP